MRSLLPRPCPPNVCTHNKAHALRRRLVLESTSAMLFFSLMLGDTIVLVLLLVASPLLVTLSSGLLFLQYSAVLCNYLGSMISYVLCRLSPKVSLLSSTFSNLAQGLLMKFTFAEYAAAWHSSQATVGLPQCGSQYHGPPLGACE